LSIEETKNARSRRTIFLPSQLLKKLAAHKRTQAERRLKLGAAWKAFDLVFCGAEGTPLSIPNLTYRYFRPILEKAELPQIRLYDLPHSCATLLLIAEENPKVVAKGLGIQPLCLPSTLIAMCCRQCRRRQLRGWKRCFTRREVCNTPDGLSF
jgi:integrase